MILKRLMMITLPIYLLFGPIVSFADYPSTREDFAFLPPYCIAQLKPEWSRPGEPALWKQRLPGGFAHLHHWCAALHSIRIANKILPDSIDAKMTRGTLFRGIIGDIKYMEDKADPNFILLPEMYTSKAEALFALDRNGEAVSSLTQAIQKNNKFTKAYSLLANYYLKTGNKKSAKETLEEGLKYSPDSKVLKNKLGKLSKE